MVEYKLFKLRSASKNLASVNKGLNKLAEEGWIIEFFDDSWIIMARIKEKEEEDGDNKGSSTNARKTN